MAQRGTYLVPTLLAGASAEAAANSGRLTGLRAEKARAAAQAMRNGVKIAARAGVPIAFGTDAGVFEHGRNAGEFALLVQYGGLTPAEAIASATTVAARLLGLENEIGRIAPGFSADLIAVTGDPLADVRLLEHVDFVMVRGRPVE